MKALIVDDHAILRSGLRALLESRSGFVIHESASGREAVCHAKLVRPDIVVMDVSMPDLNGIDATRRITNELPGTRIIGLSMHTDVRYAAAMMAAGASGY